jgi:uncharacterized protein YbjT (DUF2867 family)
MFLWFHTPANRRGFLFVAGYVRIFIVFPLHPVLYLPMNQKIITIVGGTGFLGRYIVRRLAKAGYTLRVISRHPDAALYLKTAGDVGQVVLMGGDIARPETIAGKLEGSFAVINLVGILYETGAQTFNAVQAQGAEKLAQMARAALADRFIHVSALAIEKGAGSKYARTKIIGENAVLAAFPDATILRPSIIFGPEDNFINQFARMSAISPVLPLIGGGKNRFQPVYVDDVARAVEVCLTDNSAKGQTYELGGPETYTFREILQYILDLTGRRRKLVNVPFSAASTLGSFAEMLPRPLITRDQVKLLKADNVVSPESKHFDHLGIKPVGLEAVVPEYLSRHKPLAAA